MRQIAARKKWSFAPCLSNALSIDELPSYTTNIVLMLINTVLIIIIIIITNVIYMAQIRINAANAPYRLLRVL